MIAKFLDTRTHQLITVYMGLLAVAFGFTLLSRYLPPDLVVQLQVQLHEAILSTGALILAAIIGSKAENTARNFGVTTPPPHELKETPKP